MTFERQMSFDCLRFVTISDRERQRRKERANELKLEVLIRDRSNDKFLETVLKWNESKNLVNLTMCDRDLVVCNTSKCEEEKTKEENSKNVDVNLTTEANRTVID